MASNAPVPKADPLSFMTKLSPFSYLYRPESSAPPPAASAKTSPPKLVLICSWMGAQNLHVAKYIQPYLALYPTSQILLVKCELKHFLNPPVGYAEATKAVPIIRAALDPADPSPQLAVHVFSNGGSSVLSHLYRAFRESAKPGEATVIPVHTTIIDSAPGEYAWGRSIVALTTGLSTFMKLLIGPLVRLWLVYYLFLGLFRPDPLKQLALSHNDPKQAKEVRRTYIYSEEDKLVDWKVVEKYAKDAKSKGFNTRLEKFSGSAHVAHARQDETRYWKIVKETWEP
ncbi:hypothetical protein GQ53DRAFT_751638 [Thozetella sp. PMI_491]|nr:hypothetical protein GQ53DRAFT_751638 [Thozetella sp. PMI_491]